MTDQTITGKIITGQTTTDKSKFLKDICYEAGDIIRQYFFKDKDTEIKEDGSPVTIVDKKINSLVIERILNQFPDHSIIGEEESFGPTDNEYVWICDPIDGTRPFTAGIPISTFSLSLLKREKNNLLKPILASAYDPFLNKLIIAEKNQGAVLIHNNDTKTLPPLVSPTSKPTVWIDGPLKTETIDISKLLKGLIDQDINFFTGRSYIYGCMLVAEGKLDAAIFIGKTPWDVAAPELIITECNGVCTSLYGENQSYQNNITGAIVANKSTHAMILEITKKI